ncbi:hypothetical protein CXG81DRAFT_29974 [Caulochytrium protostelioides]|uniref:Dolichyl-phosphate-mannose--protein mannosyltransferase n=1 Tax=Caulochytrium protostelioides TaxID=1555241 RepID=A0A4P9X5P2_9FUNG|nr:hypothetical protein CXG81DRAFT_29974 [Caulochytrium protostelioides]|eukprot:RKP00453.1 hypothetical protein CXG81DRAFT_29974 [Caulochytrium protostelioides]
MLSHDGSATSDDIRAPHEADAASIDDDGVDAAAAAAARHGADPAAKYAKPGRFGLFGRARDPDARFCAGAFGDHDDWKTPLVLLVLALAMRFWRITESKIVVWDEAHFGKFASHYLKGEFYFDVHPPLGKMLNGLAGWIGGYNGSFPFESGSTYTDDVAYGTMRVFNALFGAVTIPLAFMTCQQLHMSYWASLAAAIGILCDMALLSISRFILLDSMLLCMTGVALYTLCVFRNFQVRQPLSRHWYFWLLASGLSLGLALSVKWIGLFSVAMVGLHTLDDLWSMLGDLSMSKKTYARHLVSRVGGLIAIPALVYMWAFMLHFTVLTNSGPGDAQMSSLFQAGLNGNTFDKNPLHIAYGSKVSIKNNGRGGALLHSHVQHFPVGSMQQQVTAYQHKDANNEFFIRRAWDTPSGRPANATDPAVVPNWVADERDANDPDAEPQILRDGDIVRLVHAQTGRNLHSHKVNAPITVGDYEVSCYGDKNVGDINDHWRVERVDDVAKPTPGMENAIRSLSTRFRLRHVVLGCLLRSHAVNLPQWGFKQLEVFCQKKEHADPLSLGNLWNIELHENSKLPPGGPGAYKSRFLNDFLDLNVAMWSSNNALTPDADKEPDALTSRPIDWPFGTVGLRMCGWGDDAIKFYLLGHPLLWMGSTLAIVALAALCVVYLCRWQRHYKDWPSSRDNALHRGGYSPLPPKQGIDALGSSDFDDTGPDRHTAASAMHTPADGVPDTPARDGLLRSPRDPMLRFANFYFATKVLLGGWALHYLPFFLMGRVTYLHHYFPAVYFAIMAMMFLIDHGVSRVAAAKALAPAQREATKRLVFAGFSVAIVLIFLYFKDIVYGMHGPAHQWSGRRWLQSWKIHD